MFRSLTVILAVAALWAAEAAAHPYPSERSISEARTYLRSHSGSGTEGYAPWGACDCPPPVYSRPAPADPGLSLDEGFFIGGGGVGPTFLNGGGGGAYVVVPAVGSGRLSAGARSFAYASAYASASAMGSVRIHGGGHGRPMKGGGKGGGH